MTAYYIGICLSAFLGYAIVAGTVYALLPTRSSQSERLLIAWGWLFLAAIYGYALPVFGVYELAKRIYRYPAWIERRIKSRRANARLPKAQVWK